MHGPHRRVAPPLPGTARQVYRLITKGTVDQNIYNLSQRKLRMDSAVLDGITTGKGGKADESAQMGFILHRWGAPPRARVRARGGGARAASRGGRQGQAAGASGRRAARRAAAGCAVGRARRAPGVQGVPRALGPRRADLTACLTPDPRPPRSLIMSGDHRHDEDQGQGAANGSAPVKREHNGVA